MPLRQYGPDRLDPPIKLKYIESGYRDTSSSGQGLMKTNRPEAENVVETILSCIDDPRYENKTMGVISLLGDQQAKLIEGMLMKNMAPSAYEKRKLLCGTPASFQGDERNVIFISMVDAPPSRLSALTKDTDKRRLNVSVSRAKDQLFVFHSFKLSDLKSNCFRHRLIHYCANPHRAIEEQGIDKCESQFERDVFTDIIDRGYRVIPQVEVAGKYIDLVVEGMRARLAVECDGDQWHGPGKWEDDMMRQRTLERCGWTFWRVRGSEYYRNPEDALNTLWDRLDDMQIYLANLKEEHDNADTSGSFDNEERTEEEEFQGAEPETEADVETVGMEPDMKTESIRPHIQQGNLFHKRQSSSKVNKQLIREIIFQLLKENTQGQDLLPNRVIRRVELGLRGSKRVKEINRINRIIREMIKEGEIEQYKTQKRVRYKLPD